ncbi:MAG: VTT domain-containing protein [Chloroflexota bacterium]
MAREIEVKETLETKPRLRKRDISRFLLAAILVVAVSLAVIYYGDNLMSMTLVARYSLIGMLAVAFLAGSTLSFIPVAVPYWLLLFTLPGVLAGQWGILAPVSVGLASALGCALGHLPTFMLGYSGTGLSRKVTTSKIPVFNKAMEWANKRGAWAVFVMSAIPNPAHLPVTMAIGALRYSPTKFFIFSLLGNTVKSLTLAFCGYFGITSLFRFLGM